MQSKQSGSTHVISLFRGEHIIQSLLAYCKKHQISCGCFSGLGAVDDTELAHYRVEDKKYSSQKFEEPMEIAGLVGNITTMNNEPYIHAHITCGRSDMSVASGHLKEARVHAVCEIFLTVVDLKITREHNEEIGLNVMRFDYSEGYK